VQKDVLHCPTFFLSLIYLVIPGMIEPWPECQPEQKTMSTRMAGGACWPALGEIWLAGSAYSITKLAWLLQGTLGTSLGTSATGKPDQIQAKLGVRKAKLRY